MGGNWASIRRIEELESATLGGGSVVDESGWEGELVTTSLDDSQVLREKSQKGSIGQFEKQIASGLEPLLVAVLVCEAKRLSHIRHRHCSRNNAFIPLR